MTLVTEYHSSRKEERNKKDALDSSRLGALSPCSTGGCLLYDATIGVRKGHMLLFRYHVRESETPLCYIRC